MNYWWVNQNKTWEHEISGGYMWSPKRNKNAAFNQFYENMRLVDPGDRVFAFYKQHLQKIGIAQRGAITADRPPEFGKAGEVWASNGWFVPVEWHDLPNVVLPADHIEQIRPHLPAKYSPLNPRTGRGHQRYLVHVPEGLAGVLLNLTAAEDIDIVDVSTGITGQQGSIDRIDDHIETEVRNDTNISETEKEAVVKARRGQGRFRKNVMAIEPSCRVTGISDPRLLKAGHIQPWRNCKSNAERLDGHNGLMLAPHIDHLFDHGYISFEMNGAMMVSTRIPHDQLQRLGIDGDNPPNVGQFSDDQEEYMKHHRDHVFVRV